MLALPPTWVKEQEKGLMASIREAGALGGLFSTRTLCLPNLLRHPCRLLIRRASPGFGWLLFWDPKSMLDQHQVLLRRQGEGDCWDLGGGSRGVEQVVQGAGVTEEVMVVVVGEPNISQTLGPYSGPPQSITPCPIQPPCNHPSKVQCPPPPPLPPTENKQK